MSAANPYGDGPEARHAWADDQFLDAMDALERDEACEREAVDYPEDWEENDDEL